MSSENYQSCPLPSKQHRHTLVSFVVSPAYARNPVPTIHSVLEPDGVHRRRPGMHRCDWQAKAGTEGKSGLRMKSDRQAWTHRLFFPLTEVPG